jgi:vacuolar-type H+-ATPase catalytic subunit A/Vma1
MIGAHKLNINEVERLREMFNQGLNNSQIARQFKTLEGKTISREHVSQIRRGKRWNFTKHSYLMKEHIENQDVITTVLEEEIYETQLGLILSNNGDYHVYLCFKDGSIMEDMNTPLMTNKPTTEEMLSFHNKWIWNEISGI